MSRYIVLPVLTFRNVPAYVIVDSATGARIRSYDCELWAQHEADALNGRTRPQTAPPRRFSIVGRYLSAWDRKGRQRGGEGARTE